MTTVRAAELDSYVLPVPGPDTPVVQARWISPANTFPNSRFSEDLWSLGPLTDNPGESIHRIRWSGCPAVLQAQFRVIVWTMINGELRPTYVKERACQQRSRDGVLSMRDCVLQWFKFARWLAAQGVTRLQDCTSEHWVAFAATRAADGIRRDHMLGILRWLTDIWAFDQLSARPCGVTCPPWEAEGIDDYLPAETASAAGENRTDALDPAVIGPLLTWSIRMVDDFADDILAAFAERRRMHAIATATKSSAEGRAALLGYVTALIDADAPLPATVHRGRGLTLANHYVAYVTGASQSQVCQLVSRLGLKEVTARNPGPSPMQIPVTGRLEGRPWREHMDYEETLTLVRHLVTAAAIVITYLTGMRSQEKGAELRLMQHPTGRATRISAGGRGCLRGHRARCNRSASDSCA